MEPNTQTPDSIPVPPGRLTERIVLHKTISQKLASLNDASLSELLCQASPQGTGIGGTALHLNIDGALVFVKKVRLTDRERQPQNMLSTANLFELPTFYQYGIGSAGFGAWRELTAHTMSTDWVLTGQCPHFPLLYHWRVLPISDPKTPTQEDLAALTRSVYFWQNNTNVRARLEELQNASTEIVLFLEHFPENLRR